jgi:hypothetical protein
MGVAAAISTITNSERHMNDLAELKSKARAATQGEWAVNPTLAQIDAFESSPAPVCQMLWPTELRSEAQTFANAAYIAAAQPSVVLELIERIRAAESAKAAEPVAWLIEHPHEGKSVDLAHDGTRPLYPADEEAGFAASPLYAAPPDVSALQERVRALEEALGWYGEQARLCRLIHSGGDAGRNALSEDGGKRARKALGDGNE